MEDVDTTLPRAEPIPRTLDRIALKDNRENGGDAGKQHKATEKQQDSPEGLARKEPIIGRDDGTFDESVSSEVAKIAYIEWYADA